MENPAFRVRMGTARPASARALRVKKLSSRVKALVTKHGGVGGRKLGGGRYSQFGRGGHAAAQFAARAGRQRVAVKARVVRARPGGQSDGSIRAHLRYIRGRGEGAEGHESVVFNGEGQVSQEEAFNFADRVDGDRHHFRFIISPEGGERLDLKAYTQELVAGMEKDLGTRLDWVAGDHHDTDDPHVHLMIRGKDELGGDLVINREYISFGMRAQAMEVATRHLGPRLAEEIERSQQRELTADRLTAHDLRLAADAASHANGFVSPLRGRNGSLAAEGEQVRSLARLQHLESLGLAHERAAGVWEVDPDLVVQLRRMGSHGDVIKLMHERMKGTEPTIATVIFSKESPPTEAVTGRVYDKGVADALYDRRYLLVEGSKGRAYYVPLSEYSERPGHEAAVGSIVTIAPAGKHPARAADRNLALFAARHEGVYDPALHTAFATDRLRLPEGVSPADYVDSHMKRAKALASRGVIEALPDGRFRIPTDLPERAARAVAGGRDSGGLLKVERESLQNLDAQVEAHGVTWLDRELARGVDPNAALRVGATRFERDLQGALKRRAKTLRSLGLAEEAEGPVRLRAQFLDQLYERELADAGHRLRGRYGELERLEAGTRLAGKAVAVEQLPSGPHVVVAEEGRYALVPAHGALTQQIGKTVEITVGAAPRLNALQPAAMQLAVRFRAMNFTRSRGLGR